MTILQVQIDHLRKDTLSPIAGSGWTPCSRKSSAWRSRGQIRAALATFVAFVFVGLVPLIPFMIPDLSIDTRFFAIAVATAIAFFEVGAAKGAVLQRSALHSGSKRC